MRMLFLADAVFEDLPGGSRVVARELARGLAGRGHEVTFLVARQAPGTPDLECRDGVRIVRYAGAGRAADFVREGRRACTRLCAEGTFDVVCTHFAYAALGPLRALPGSVPRVRFFYGSWDTEGWVEDGARVRSLPWSRPLRRGLTLAQGLAKRALRRRVEVASLRSSRRVVVLSEYSRDLALTYGRPGGPIRVIPGGTDVERFVPAPDRGAARRALGLPAGRRVLFSVRRLAPRMGLDSLIRAMPAVIARHPDVLLLIGGKGPERERLETLTRDLRLTDHVRLLGFIPDEDLARHHQAADLFVLPTAALEGFGLVTTEALACGVPVLGTPVGATPEILGGLDRRLIASGVTPEALSDGILGFFEGEWARALTPERLRRHVLENYTWERHVEAVEEMSLELAGGGASRMALPR